MAVRIKYMVFVACLITAVDGECVNSTTYNGTLNVTLNGYTCQRWDSQYPHEHDRNTTNYFPNDASVYDAHNYCRDAGGTHELWCYTTDEDERWDYCVSLNETCTIFGEEKAIYCTYLREGENSTHCPNETEFYQCVPGFDEDMSYISRNFDLWCDIYSCCVFDTDVISSSTADENLSISTIYITTPISGGKCCSWSFNVYMFIFVLQVLVLTY